MLPAASIENPSTVTLEQGLVATNSSSHEVEVSYKGRRYNYPAYNVQIDGLNIVGNDDMGGRLFFIASQTLDFSQAGNKYVKIVEHDSVHPDQPEVKWVDTSKTVQTVWGECYIRYASEPDDVEASSSENTSETANVDPWASHFTECLKFQEAIQGLPGYPGSVPVEHQERLDQLMRKTFEMLREHPGFNLETSKAALANWTENLDAMAADYHSMRVQFLGCDPKELASANENEDEAEERALMKLFFEAPLSSLVMDCGGLIRMLENRMRRVALGVEGVKKVIAFQEKPLPPSSEAGATPFVELQEGLAALVRSGLLTEQ